MSDAVASGQVALSVYKTTTAGQQFPLLTVHDALSDVSETLLAVCDEVTRLQHDTEGHYPPSGEAFVRNIRALLGLLADVMPAAFKQAVDDEQTLYDLEEARWEPTASPNYQWGA